MDRSSSMKLIDLLALRPGTFLCRNAVTGEAVCKEVQSIFQYADWQEEVSQAAFPDSSAVKLQNFQKLLDIPIAAHLVLRHSSRNVVEMLRFTPRLWTLLEEKVGCEADIMADSKLIASGRVDIIETHVGIHIQKNYCWRDKLHCN